MLWLSLWSVVGLPRWEILTISAMEGSFETDLSILNAHVIG